jgi:hypothetical protein
MDALTHLVQIRDLQVALGREPHPQGRRADLAAPPGHGRGGLNGSRARRSLLRAPAHEIHLPGFDLAFCAATTTRGPNPEHVGYVRAEAALGGEPAADGVTTC